MTTKNNLSIKSIEVEKLFGIYSYKVPMDQTHDISKLLILYGDNGSGKTTILQLLFWILSSLENSGYKTKMSRTKFQHFKLTLENGVEIGAIRNNTSLLGGFKFYIKNVDKKTNSVILKLNPNEVIRLEDNSKEHIAYQKLLLAIKHLNISVFYLSDDRKILNSNISSDNEIESFNRRGRSDTELSFNKELERVIYQKGKVEKKLSIEPALEKLIEWIRTKTILDSRTGEKNSQVIFTELIKNIFKLQEVEPQFKNKKEILEEVQKIEKNIKPYTLLGLLDEFDSKSLYSTIKKAKTSEQENYLIKIITPYIDSINAKLKALEKLAETINLFINSVNDYFTNKQISFNLNSGFTIVQKGGESIDFEQLSSGEKQLLLLLINTITATDEATIFIIDEPEISLNIKWQRNLIDTLMKFIVGKKIQYIISTHSIELLTSSIDQVYKLEDIDGNS